MKQKSVEFLNAFLCCFCDGGAGRCAEPFSARRAVGRSAVLNEQMPQAVFGQGGTARLLLDTAPVHSMPVWGAKRR